VSSKYWDCIISTVLRARALRTEQQTYNFLLQLSFTGKSTALWHLFSVSSTTVKRLSQWVYHSLLPFVHTKASGDYSPAYTVLPRYSSWSFPLGM